MSTPELTDDSPAPAGEVGELIRRFRYRLGMTQQELADFSTVSVRAIRDLERGATQQPRRETLRLIADALRLDGEAVAAIDEAVGRELGEAGRTRGGHAPTSVGGLIGADVFLGREDVIALLRSRLWDHGDRVVGLTGAPGVGKSRLATELAAGTSGGMVLWHDVPGDRPLARHTRSGSVISRAVQAVHRGGRAKAGDGVRTLVRLVGDAPALLVLDGLDRAPDPVALGRLLTECPGVRVLYTAVRPRGLFGERLLPVQPLDCPPRDAEPQALAGFPAVRLVLGHAPASRADTDVAAVCRLLDGLPLALESAASLLRIYGPRTLLRALLDDPFPLLEAHAFATARPLRGRLASAVGELGPDELAVLRKLCEDGVATVEDVAAASGRGLTECGASVHGLLASGLIVEEAWGRFRPLHLVRALVRSPRVRRHGRAFHPPTA